MAGREHVEVMTRTTDSYGEKNWEGLATAEDDDEHAEHESAELRSVEVVGFRSSTELLRASAKCQLEMGWSRSAAAVSAPLRAPEGPGI